MKAYQLVIFDWDGTLMDSIAKIIRCMQLTALRCGQPVPSDAQVGDIIGISLRPAIARLFNLRCDETVTELVATYKTIFVEQDAEPCPLFAGAPALLDALTANGRQLAVATGKARRGLDRAWRNTNTGGYFIASRTACEAQSKPSSDMLEQLLAETGVQVNDAVMIGDTTYDMQMAEQLGMDRIGVTYGVHDAIRLEQHRPVALVNSIEQLQHYLLA